MESVIKKVLTEIEQNGFEAYIVGGYVRDFLMSKKSYDLDICTNALPKEILTIFPEGDVNKYGGVRIKRKKYNIDITTYRRETSYIEGKLTNVKYINNLLEDMQRRDFKMNAICMNSNGIIIDSVFGYSDIKNKIVDTIGDANVRFQEDPIRMLRAVRFMTILDFNLSPSVEEAIVKNRNLLLANKSSKIKNELEKILISKNCKKGMECLKKLGVLSVLNIHFDNIKPLNNPLAMWSQLDFEFNESFTKEEKTNIINIRTMLLSGKIDNFSLFNYGLYLCITAGEIMGIPKSTILKMDKNLPIHNIKEIKVDADYLINKLGYIQDKNLGEAINNIKDAILNGSLNNEEKDIVNYLTNK